MNIIDWVKGVFNRMIGKESIVNALKLTPVMSDLMRQSIEQWENMYMNQSPWLNDKTKSLGIASLVASEKARMATLEMEVKITGTSEKAKFVQDTFKDVTYNIRKQLEYGIALGGLIIKPYPVLGPNDKYSIKFNYTKASDFYPLAFSAGGELTSAAFIDKIIKDGKVYSKVEVHTLSNNNVTVQNRAFVAKFNPNIQEQAASGSILGDEIALSSVPEWSILEPETIIENVDTLLFAYFKNPEANTVDITSPLGASGFSRAVDLIKEADVQYSNLLWEFEGGQLAVDVDWTALNPLKTNNGDVKYVLPALQDRLFRRNLDLGSDETYNVFSPQLRDASILNGLNNILMHIEDVTSLARGTISEVTMSEARTATELKILKQRAYAANADVQKSLEIVFETVFNIIDIYCILYDIVPEGEYEVGYNWDDSIIVDKDAERQLDLIDVESGLMSKVEYRMKWKGETRTQAEEALQEIAKETEASMLIQQKAMQSSVVTDKQEEADKKQRAKESNEPTNNE